MKKHLRISIVACACALALTLAACGSQEAAKSDEASTGAASAAAESPGAMAVSFGDLTSQSDKSLIATHPSVIEGTVESATCLQSCHDYEDLVADTATKLLDEGGKTVFNVHAGHVSYDCTDCHTADADPVLRCNTCHYMTAPDGWDSPEEGSKAAYVDPGTIYGDLGYSTAGERYGMGDNAGYGIAGYHAE